MRKFDVCFKCEFRNDDPPHVCEACDEGDQFEESFDPDEDEDYDEDAQMLGRRVFMIKEAA